MDIPEAYCAAFHESSNRHDLLLGCDSSALGLAFVVCFIIGASVPNVWGISCTVFLFLFLRQVLREMAKEDPILIRIYDESQRYRQKFWTAK